MSRGGLSYAGIGEQFATFKAGAGIKALVAAANRDAVVGLAVVVSAAQTVDLGADGDSVFGFIDVYENDGHVGVQFRGFREGVPVNAVAPTVGKIAATDGTGKIKDSGTTAKLRNPITVDIDSVAGTATVFLG